MVGKDQAKGSRIFHQCYLKYCKVQNLTPLNALAPSGNGKVLDFCVDRIKYQDWPPILNALSCDLSLHTVAIKCRQQVKTVLEHVDCERLAKTVNKRAVILTNFMLSNLIEAVSQLLSKSTLLTTLILEGLPLKILYLNPLCEGLQTSSSLEHISLSRCLIGDAGCQAVCKTIRGLPNVVTLDLSGCELTQVGAAAIADLIKFQKLHRYSENWVHTLRYRLPELDTMSGLRRITLCNNPQLGDQGVCKLLEILADDLWIKALDVQNCGLMENAASLVLQMLKSNTTLVVLDMRHNPDISGESLSAVRAQLRQNERGIEEKQYSWLSNTSSTVDSRSMKSVPYKNTLTRERSMPNTRTSQNKSYVSKNKERSPEELEKQLQEEILHRKQLEELNLQLVEQMKQLKQQQIQLWSRTCNGTSSPTFSGFEQSVQASSRSGDLSSSSGSSSVPIDQNTLSYVQQAFKDIYAFIKNNQCNGGHDTHMRDNEEPAQQAMRDVVESENLQANDLRANIVPKKAQSAHINMLDIKMNKTTKSAHMLRDSQLGNTLEMKPEMIERQMGDSKNAHGDENSYVEELIVAQTKTNKKNNYYDSPCSSKASESSDTLICSSSPSFLAPNPRDAFYSSTDEDSS